MDSNWLEQCRKGNEAAVAYLVQTHQRDVYRLALSILDDPSDAEDATQDVFISALRALESFRENASLKTWLFSITINTCRSRLQRKKSRKRLQQILESLFHLHSEQPHLENEATKNEADAALWRAVSALDEKYRIPVILRYQHDLIVSDIAEMLGLPVGTVHSRLNHARARLRELLKEEQE